MLTVTRISLNKLLFPALGLLLLVASCAVKPKPPVPEDKMQALLMDLHLAEAYSSVVPTDSLSRDVFGKNRDSLAVFYKDVLARHQLSYQELVSAMNWYQEHPALLDSIYSRMQVRLDSLRSVPDSLYQQ